MQFAAPARKLMIEHTNTIVVIPARMASVRLPGKPLADINGEPMIVHVWKRAQEAKVGQVLVAAAESEIVSAIRARGGDAIVTDPKAPSGSDRIAEALRLRDPERRWQYVVNLQGDLPTIDSLAIRRCLAGLMNEAVDISTIAARIEAEADVMPEGRAMFGADLAEKVAGEGHFALIQGSDGLDDVGVGDIGIGFDPGGDGRDIDGFVHKAGEAAADGE